MKEIESEGKRERIGDIGRETDREWGRETKVQSLRQRKEARKLTPGHLKLW